MGDMMTEPLKKDPKPDDNRLPIVRDNTFRQLYADAFLPLPLVNGLDIAILAATPLIHGEALQSIEDDEGNPRLSIADVSPRAAFTEVARLRLDLDAFGNLLSVVLGAAIQTGYVTVDQIDAMVKSADKAYGESEDSNG